MQKILLFIPGPVTVAEPVLAAMARPLINHRGPEFGALLERITDRLKPIFGTKNDVLLLGASGTGGLEAGVTNLFGPGDTLLACPIGTFGDRIISIAKTWGCSVEVLETAWGAGVDPDALGARLRADRDKKITGILFTHNETSTGVQIDMAAMARAVGDHPAITVVDSVSGLGASEFKMDDWKLDLVITASQKALAVPPGIAMIAVSPRAWEKIAQNKAPRFYFDLRKARGHGFALERRRGRRPFRSSMRSMLRSTCITRRRRKTFGPGTRVTPRPCMLPSKRSECASSRRPACTR